MAAEAVTAMSRTSAGLRWSDGMDVSAGHVSRDQRQWRQIYLNDHVAGAAGGVALARRLERANRGTEAHGELLRLAEEIAQDRRSLQHLLRSLGLRDVRYKSFAATMAERVSRFKLNGRIRGRSPLSTLIELEALRLGVEGKAAGWRTLREIATSDARISAEELDGLIHRATEQAETLEQLRVRVVRHLSASTT